MLESVICVSDSCCKRFLSLHSRTQKKRDDFIPSIFAAHFLFFATQSHCNSSSRDNDPITLHTIHHTVSTSSKATTRGAKLRVRVDKPRNLLLNKENAKTWAPKPRAMYHGLDGEEEVGRVRTSSLSTLWTWGGTEAFCVSCRARMSAIMWPGFSQ